MEVAKEATGDHKEVDTEAHLVKEAQPQQVVTANSNSQVTELNKLAVTEEPALVDTDQEAEPLLAVTAVQQEAMAPVMLVAPATRSSTCQ